MQLLQSLMQSKTDSQIGSDSLGHLVSEGGLSPGGGAVLFFFILWVFAWSGDDHK